MLGGANRNQKGGVARINAISPEGRNGEAPRDREQCFELQEGRPVPVGSS